jgi:hypothetical protein
MKNIIYLISITLLLYSCDMFGSDDSTESTPTPIPTTLSTPTPTPTPSVGNTPNPITDLIIATSEVLILTDSSAHVVATIVPTDADDPEITWTTDDDCITIIPHPTLERACFINSGTQEGYARVTATSSAIPELSEGFDIIVVKETALTSGTINGIINERGTIEPNMSYYVVTGLNTSTEYAITISNIASGIDDFQVALGLLSPAYDDFVALDTDGYVEDAASFYYQGFITNSGATSTSILFLSNGDRQYFTVSDASADGDLGEFTFDLEINGYSGNKEILQTMACSGGTDIDTYFYVYNEDEEVICGAFDNCDWNGPENGFSKVLLPGGFLPGMFWVLVAAQEYNDYGFPVVVDPTAFAMTGDYAIYYDDEAGGGIIGYSGTLPSALSGDDLDERTNEHNQHYADNWAHYPTLAPETPIVRKISPLADITVTDGYEWDVDMFKSF